MNVHVIDASVNAGLNSALAQLSTVRRLVIGFSGGVDSTVLLHAVCQSRLRGTLSGLEVSALHIVHGLCDQSQEWESHCRQQCEQWQIGYDSVDISSELAAGKNIEARARNARYRVFEQRLGQRDLLLLAHHRDDQLETLLLRLCRGSGSKGLAAMPAQRRLGSSWLVRPLLSVARKDIETYAGHHQLSYITDPGNTDLACDRNYLRHQLLPLIASRWPGYSKAWLRAINHSAEAARLCEELAAADLAATAEGSELLVTGLEKLPPMRRRNLLRYWLQQQGLVPPTAASLGSFLDTIFAARADRNPVLRWSQGELYRYRDRLFVAAVLPPVPTGNHHWQPERQLLLSGMGKLSAEPVETGGMALRQMPQVRFRSGGEVCRPAVARHTATLKKWFQHYRLPPRYRNRIPLIYQGGELAAVGDLWICQGFGQKPGEPGWKLTWERP